MFPTPFTVLWYSFNGEGEDEMGNDAESWEEDGDERPVISWEPTKMGSQTGLSESLAQGNTSFSSRSIDHVDLRVPPDFGAWDLRDRVALPSGGMYEVTGAQDLSGGWHGWHPGDVIQLKKVD